VTVRAQTLDGLIVELDATGLLARALQHEIDHLNGILCCDRMDPRTLMTSEHHARTWRGQSLEEVRAALHAPRRPA
jgi:peptide deformylase